MKGITDQIASLTLGESIEIQDTERSNIYAIAKRKGVKVCVRKSPHGYTVERVGLAPVSAVVETHTEPLSDSHEWIDIGEHWNEITGDMVEMQRHYKTGAFRQKHG
jgi:hypothetical protein